MPRKGQSDHDPGYIYCMSNPSNPNSIKIGLSRDPFDRSKSLSNTSQPLPFRPTYIWFVYDMKEAENAAHICMSAHRVNEKREFFNLVVKDAHDSGALKLPTEYDTQDEECPDINLVENYMYSIRECIEEGWECVGIRYARMDVEVMENEHKEAKLKNHLPSYRLS